MLASGQTNREKLEAMLADVRKSLSDRTASRRPARQHYANAAATPARHTDQLVLPYFADVDLTPSTAFYIDCGATNEYVDGLGRRWMRDEPFLVTSIPFRSTYPNAPIIGNALVGDHYLPDMMLNSERWFFGNIQYQVAVPTAGIPCCSTSPRTIIWQSARRWAELAVRIARAPLTWPSKAILSMATIQPTPPCRRRMMGREPYTRAHKLASSSR